MKEIAQRYSGNSNILVLVVDFETLDCEEAVATNISSTGCRVISTTLGEKDKLVGVRLTGIDKMIKGRIREVRAEDVSIAFEFQDDITSEKRKEKRRPVSIAAQVSSSGAARSFSCKIVDASLSGCRLQCDDLDLLSDAIILKIPGMDLPVRGAIVWRVDSFAGVKMMWQFSRKSELQNAETIKVPSLVSKVRANNPQLKAESKKDTAYGLKRRPKA